MNKYLAFSIDVLVFAITVVAASLGLILCVEALVRALTTTYHWMPGLSFLITGTLTYVLFNSLKIPELDK